MHPIAESEGEMTKEYENRSLAIQELGPRLVKGDVVETNVNAGEYEHSAVDDGGGDDDGDDSESGLPQLQHVH